MKRFTTVLVAAMMLSAALLGRTAEADPVANKRAEAARLAAELESKGRQAAVLTEQYNAARIKAGAAEADAAKAAQALAAADAAVKRTHEALKASAVEAYMHGGFLPLNKHAASPKDATELTVRRKYVSVVADRQNDALKAMRVARQDAANRRAQLEEAKETSRQALAAVEGKRQAAAAAVAAQQAVLNRVKGELATLVAEEQRRKAEEEARRVRAALAARQAAPPGGAPRTVTGSPIGRDTGTAPTNPPPPPNAGAATAVAEAKRQLGKPYQWGGAGPDTFDCSGLTAWAWKAAGKTLPHYTVSQYNATARVAIKDLQPGDLVFFGEDMHHMGLYVGNGTMIHAPQTGDVVKYSTIYRSDLVESGGRVY